MAERCGFSLYGSMPVMVNLICDHGLAEACGKGVDAVGRILAESGLDNPLLLQCLA